MIHIIVGLACVGLISALYGLFVERTLKENKDYKPVCDISDRVSCTRPMLSSYANMFGISNSALCALYYVSIMLIAFWGNTHVLFLMTSIGMLATLFFAYILYFKIKSFCLICTMMYLINLALISICYYNL